MSKYIDQGDLEAAISEYTLAELFNDLNTGVLNTVALTLTIDRAEAEVDSRLLGYRSYPIGNQYDRLLKHAALTFAMAFSFERHPEYVRQFGDDGRGGGMYERAEKMMDRIQAGISKLPDQATVVPTVAVSSESYQPIVS